MTETALGIDTNLFIRQAARRMLGACCERTRTRIYVPGQTLREAPEKIRTLYGRAAARMSARTRPGETEGARKQRTLATLEAMCAGFVKWMHEEGKRNDGIYQYGQARGMDPEVRSLGDWIGASAAGLLAGGADGAAAAGPLWPGQSALAQGSRGGAGRDQRMQRSCQGSSVLRSSRHRATARRSATC